MNTSSILSGMYDIEGDCWIWNGRKDPQGYPIMSLDGKSVSVHRFAYMLENQIVLPSYTAVRKTCKDKRCINPQHLTT